MNGTDPLAGQPHDAPAPDTGAQAAPRAAELPYDGPGLLEPRRDPETMDETQGAERDRDRRRWLEERPPHYEPR